MIEVMSDLLYTYINLYCISLMISLVSMWVLLSFVDRVHTRERARRVGVSVSLILANICIYEKVYDYIRLLIIRPMCAIVETSAGFVEGLENFDPIIALSDNANIIAGEPLSNTVDTVDTVDTIDMIVQDNALDNKSPTTCHKITTRTFNIDQIRTGIFNNTDLVENDGQIEQEIMQPRPKRGLFIDRGNELLQPRLQHQTRMVFSSSGFIDSKLADRRVVSTQDKVDLIDKDNNKVDADTTFKNDHSNEVIKKILKKTIGDIDDVDVDGDVDIAKMEKILSNSDNDNSDEESNSSKTDETSESNREVGIVKHTSQVVEDKEDDPDVRHTSKHKQQSRDDESYDDTSDEHSDDSDSDDSDSNDISDSRNQTVSKVTTKDVQDDNSNDSDTDNKSDNCSVDRSDEKPQVRRKVPIRLVRRRYHID